jgi:rRNA processing protein Gar1
VELIGHVFGPGPAGEIIVRTERPWRWGEGIKLVDRRGRALGRVENVVGPAAAPYLVVRSVDAREGATAGTRLKGVDVYLPERPQEEGKTPEFRPRTKGRPTGPVSRRGPSR